MALERKKIALVHVAKARLGLAEDDYRDILRHVAGVGSSTELDELGFDLLLEHFAQLGFVSDARARDLGARPGMATPAQVRLIRDLWEEYTNGEGTEATLGKWLDRFFGVSALRFVTAEQAPKIITGLKAMKARQAQVA